MDTSVVVPSNITPSALFFFYEMHFHRFPIHLWIRVLESYYNLQTEIELKQT